jgi:GWxTD domain-containing protein
MRVFHNRCFPAVLVALTLATGGCRMLSRPNPQLPPELQPKEGPTAAASDPAPPPATASPVPAEGSTPVAVEAAAEPSGETPIPAPSAQAVVSLPSAPQQSEGKSGRLLMEAMVTAPQARELAPLPQSPEFRKALRRWDQGPIRYIILKEEQDLFRRLQTDEDRLSFIYSFWLRRDRIVETPENEYRLEFWRRVSQAEQRFIDSTQPGWMTDRGRVWVLLGPPDERDDFRNRAKGPGVLRWIYRNRPNYFLDSNFIVAFRRSTSGIWELSNHPKDFDPVFRDLKSSVRPFSSSIGFDAVLFPNLGEVIDVPQTTLLSLYMDLGQATAPTELYRVRDGDAQVTTTEIFGTMDVRTSFEFMGPTLSGTVHTGIVMGILKGSLVAENDIDEADSDLTIRISLYPGEGEDPEKVLPAPVPFGASRENYVAAASGRLLFRTQVDLEPGTYLAVYRIMDRTSGQSGQARETFTVPARFEEGLQLSTIVLASKLAEVDTASERPDAFTLGRFRVVPELDATFHNGNTFAVYYQVSGAEFDPRTGRRRLDVEYSFSVRQGEGWLDLGDSLLYRNQTNPQAWSVPMHDWPPANYRLRVKITDVVSGLHTSNDAFFRVLPGG